MTHIKRLTTGLFLLMLLYGQHAWAGPAKGWQGWSSDLFEKAQSKKRFVILDLEAVWCHWCHVMEQETYTNPEVKSLLAQKYIPVRVDQDTNPALASRYGDWGWPATIIFAPDGTEIVKLRGYIPAPRMIALLKAVIEDPSPGPSIIAEPEVRASSTPFLAEKASETILGNYEGVWDEEHAGWGSIQKFIHTESLDYALHLALEGDAKAKTRVRRTLDAALKLLDREWGGVYQYSDKRDWSSPHYEKIMWYQAQYMRQYALAYTIWKDEKYLLAARNIQRYLSTLMTSNDGAFFTSQDADLNATVDGKTFYALDSDARSKLGLPRIDRNIYARDNGWAISGLVALYNATDDTVALKQAERAAEWIVNHRQLASGGFAHGESDKGGPYLGDTLAMGEAMLALYAATGKRKWLERAASAGDFIGKTFRDKKTGFVTSATRLANTGVFSRPVRQVEENIQLARFFNLLHRYTGNKFHREQATHVMKYLTSEQITGMRRFLVGIVLADLELSREPIHLTIVGRKDDKQAQALHAKARLYPALYKRVDWWDPVEGPMLNTDIEYPELDKAAAFACGNGICSLPVFDPDGLEVAVRRMTRAVSRRAEN